MPEFVRSKSVAVTWSRTSCQILVLKVQKKQCTVLGAWSGEVTRETKLANLLAQGLKSLNVDESSYIAAGGNTRGWGFADLSMPAMPGAELTSALGFELKKYTPLPLDKLNWGYRIIPRSRKNAGSRKNIRLFYIRQEIWNQWIGALGTIHHADQILPPPLALNPLFLNSTVSLPDCDDHLLYQYAVKEDKTSVTQTAWNDSLTLEEALPGFRIEEGTLRNMTQEQKMHFIPAILLGLYACTQEFGKDRTTMIPVPQQLRIKRNIASKILAAILCIYILCGFGLASLKKLQHTAEQIRRTDLQIAEVRNKLQSLREQNKQSHGEFAEALKLELQENAPAIPSLPEVLMKITGIIEPPAWISQKFEWNAGLVTFTLTSPQNDLELITKMEDTPILGDVRQLSSSFIRDNYVRRIQLNARYDTPEEKENLARKIHEEAVRREQQKKSDEKAPEAESENRPAGDSPLPPAAPGAALPPPMPVQ